MGEQTMKPNWLDEMREIEEKATSGPWRTYGDGYGVHAKNPDDILIADGIDDCFSNYSRQDLAFIAASREFIPKAIECIQDFANEIKGFCWCMAPSLREDEKCGVCNVLAKWGLE